MSFNVHHIFCFIIVCLYGRILYSGASVESTSPAQTQLIPSHDVYVFILLCECARARVRASV